MIELCFKTVSFNIGKIRKKKKEACWMKEEINETSPLTQSRVCSDTRMEVVQESQSSIGPLAGLSGGVSVAVLNVN